MLRRWILACVIAAGASTAPAQSGVNPDELYRRVRERVLNDLVRIPNYTCVQTVTRRSYSSPLSVIVNSSGKRLMQRAKPCTEVIQNREQRRGDLPLDSWDRLRLDVGIADKHEVYSWVGASRFEESDVRNLAGGGQTNTGDFASTLLSVFVEHPSMQYAGEKRLDGRRLFEYTFATPLEMSHYEISFGGVGRFIIAYHGSVFLDPDIGDVVRVTSKSSELQQSMGYCQVARELDYNRIRIGSDTALIPRESRVVAIGREGGEMLNVNSYANCREYLGESVIHFEDADAPASGAPDAKQTAPQTKPKEITYGLTFDCRIVTPIDTDHSAAGDPIDAVLRSPIQDASGKILAPRGARLHGRLTQFSVRARTRFQQATIDVGIQWHTIELGNTQVPISANLAKVHFRGASENNVGSGVGVATFYERELHLKELDTTWQTATPSP